MQLDLIMMGFFSFLIFDKQDIKYYNLPKSIDNLLFINFP